MKQVRVGCSGAIDRDRLARRVGVGDPSELTALAKGLFTDNYAAVLARCRSVLHDSDLTREAAQDTFVALIGYIARPTSLAVDLSRLLTMAVTTAQAVARREVCRKHAEGCAIQIGDLDPAAPPLTCACDSELELALARAISSLPNGQRRLVLDLLLGRSVREMAVTRGVAESTVETQLGRAQNHLQYALRRFSGRAT